MALNNLIADERNEIRNTRPLLICIDILIFETIFTNSFNFLVAIINKFQIHWYIHFTPYWFCYYFIGMPYVYLIQSVSLGSRSSQLMNILISDRYFYFQIIYCCSLTSQARKSRSSASTSYPMTGQLNSMYAYLSI